MSDTEKQIDDGGAAFPQPMSGGEVTFTGMTLRDYFAAKAMQGMCSIENIDGTRDELSEQYFNIAEESYRIADAMIAEREKR